MAFVNLLRPIKIGPVGIRNRIYMAPMGGEGGVGGFPNDETCAYFAARARGGAGLLITGTVQTNQIGIDTSTIMQLSLNDVDHIRAWSDVADRVHAFDSKIFVQLSPGLGLQGISRRTGVQVVGPSPFQWVAKEEDMYKQLRVPGGAKGEMCRALTKDEIVMMEDKMAEACLYAKFAGLDGVEIHSPHGYLIYRFLSPRSNKRTDEYGGSLKNRMRFLLNIINKSREKIGNDIALGARFSIAGRVEGDITIEESKAMVKMATEAGLDFIDVSDSCGDEKFNFFFPIEDGTMLEGAKGFKEVVDIPVLTPGVHDPYKAEQALADGMTDMIGQARQLLRDPEWPNKVKGGRIDEIRWCKRCMECIARAFDVFGYCICPWNPESGRERFNPDNWMPPYKVPWPPCQREGCPLHNDNASIAALTWQKQFRQAYETLRKTNPLPSVTGRICPHPCEDSCTRGKVDKAINMRALERFLSEQVDIRDIKPPFIVRNSHRVAVIGSGPAGLAAAHTLALLGYDVTIFEALPVAGGMLAVGVPDYRLPKKVLQRDIEYIEQVGVKIELNTPVGKELTLADLKRQAYEAIFIAVGSHKGSKLSTSGAELDGVIDGITLLREINLGEKVKVGKRVLVLGGGNVAFNCARSALRLGAAEVHIACLESRDTMPADPMEIKEGEAEGIVSHPSVTFTKILGKSGVVTGVECLKLEWMKFDEAGQLHTQPIKGSEHVLEADTVIFAIGQTPELEAILSAGRLGTNRGFITVDPETLTTNLEGVFAGGDVTGYVGSVVEAMAIGKKAGKIIDRYIKGGSLIVEEELGPPSPVDELKIVKLKKKYQNYYPRPRVEMAEAPVAKRIKDFKEVTLGYTLEQAVGEGERCMDWDCCSER